jgi:hypothetical protein
MYEQTVEIPPSRRLTIDVPPEVPAGRIILTFRPALKPPETMLLCEAALATDWNTPEEDDAWASLTEASAPLSPS